MSKPRVLIIMNGGIIQNILSDEAIEIRVIDYDTEGIDENNLVLVPGNDESERDFPAYITDRDDIEIVTTDNHETFEYMWDLPTSEDSEKEAKLHLITKAWLDINGFDRSLDEIADHELTHEQKRFHDFLTEEFNKL